MIFCRNYGGYVQIIVTSNWLLSICTCCWVMTVCLAFLSQFFCMSQHQMFPDFPFCEEMLQKFLWQFTCRAGMWRHDRESTSRLEYWTKSLPLLLASNFVRTDFFIWATKKPQCIVYVRELYCITFAKEKCWVAKDRESNLLRERSRKRSLKIFQIGCFVRWEWTSGNGREVDTRGIVEALGLSCGSRVSQLGL